MFFCWIVVRYTQGQKHAFQPQQKRLFSLALLCKNSQNAGGMCKSKILASSNPYISIDPESLAAGLKLHSRKQFSDASLHSPASMVAFRGFVKFRSQTGHNWPSVSKALDPELPRDEASKDLHILLLNRPCTRGYQAKEARKIAMRHLICLCMSMYP